VQLIQRELEKSTSDYDKEKLGERIAKLSGGVAKINVGAATESEIEGEEGTRRGCDARDAGGQPRKASCPVAAWRSCGARRRVLKPKGLSHDEENRLQHRRPPPCKSPIMQIAENAGPGRRPSWPTRCSARTR